MKPTANLRTAISHPLKHIKDISKKQSNTSHNLKVNAVTKPFPSLSSNNKEQSTDFPVDKITTKEIPIQPLLAKLDEIQVEEEQENKRSRSKRIIKPSDKFGPDFICLDDIRRSRKRRVPEEDLLLPKSQPRKSYRTHKRNSQAKIQCKECGIWTKYKATHLTETLTPSTYTCSLCKVTPEKCKRKEDKGMSPLELLILAVENDSKEAGKVMSLSEGKESVTLQSDNEKSWEEVRRTVDHFNIQERKDRSIKSYFHKIPQFQNLKYNFY